MKTLLLLALLMLVPPFVAASPELAQRADSLFARGHELSLQDPATATKVFRESAALFAVLAEQPGVDLAKTHLNAGNAWLFAGELGEAMAHYRLAEQASPLDPAVRQAVDYARSQTLDAFEESASYDLTTWLRRLPVGGFILAFGFANLLLWGLLAAQRLRAPGKPDLRKSRLFRSVLTLTILLALFSLVQLIRPHLEHRGVVIAREALPRMGNHTAYPPAFTMPLHAGTEFSVREVREDWICIELDTGDAGWLPKEAIRQL